MLTNNWYNFFKAHFLAAYQDRNMTGISVKDYRGESWTPSGSSNYQYQMFLRGASLTSVVGSEGSNGIYFGDGNVPPTAEDYRLSGNFISGLSMGAYVASVAISGGTACTTITLTVKNNGSDAVTISEIAWVERQNTNNSLKYFMFDRTVLKSPVTIAAGGQGVVVYEFSTTLPS